MSGRRTGFIATLLPTILHINPDEQLRRFEARRQDANRQWKI